jgi:hypothetical protein
MMNATALKMDRPTSRSYRHLTNGIVAGRIALGVGLMAHPGWVGRLWVGTPAENRSLQYVLRIIGGREILLGVFLILARSESTTYERRMLRLGAAFDAWDAYSALTARDGMTRQRRSLAAAVGLTYTALGLGADRLHPKPVQ